MFCPIRMDLDFICSNHNQNIAKNVMQSKDTVKQLHDAFVFASEHHEFAIAEK